MFLSSPWSQPSDSGSATPRPPQERIAEAIEEDILFGRLPPGAPLREEKLEERFGFSRHIIRGALGCLERLGIVARTRNQGASVRLFSARDVEEIHDVREILQRQAALRIPLPVAPEDLARLETIEATYEASLAAADLRGSYLANERFHDEIFGLCGNDYLRGLIRNHRALTYIMRTYPLADSQERAQLLGHHRIMLTLLRGRDHWALSELCVAHIRLRRDAHLSYLADEAQTPSRR